MRRQTTPSRADCRWRCRRNMPRHCSRRTAASYSPVAVQQESTPAIAAGVATPPGWFFLSSLRPVHHRAGIERHMRTVQHLGQHKPVGRRPVAGIAERDDLARTGPRCAASAGAEISGPKAGACCTSGAALTPCCSAQAASSQNSTQPRRMRCQRPLGVLEGAGFGMPVCAVEWWVPWRTFWKRRAQKGTTKLSCPSNRAE